MKLFQVSDGETPLSAEEKTGLKLGHIQTQAQLNEFEQMGIVSAQTWAFGRKPKNLLTIEFLCDLHKRMFGDVWEWAGEFTQQYRRLIGSDANQVRADLHNLLEDTKTWIEHSSYPVDEIAVRFHHRLTQIHPFPNGNGRFARLATDLLVAELGAAPFTWGQQNLRSQGTDREKYIASLRKADAGDITQLQAVVRS